MLKGKWQIWVAVFVSVFILQLGFNFLKNITTKENLNISFVEGVDDRIYNTLYDSSVDKYKLNISQSVKDNTSIIISPSNSTATYNGYTKYSNVLYTPIIAYGNRLIENATTDSGFTSMALEKNYSYSPFKMDLYKLLNLMEEGKTWSDFGVSKKIYNGDIVVVIPDENSIYYSYVKEAIYNVAKSNFSNIEKYIGESSLNITVETWVDSVLSKCIKSPNILQSMIDYELRDDKAENKIFLAPESMYKFVYNAIRNSDNNTNLIPVYLPTTVCIQMDVFLKTEDVIAKDFYDFILENKKFFKTIFWRIEDKEFSIRDINSRLMEFLN